MRHKLMFVIVMWLCFSIAIGVEAQQSRKKTTPRQKASQSQQTEKHSKPVVYNGSWSGKSAQDKAVSFEVVNGRITTFRAWGLFRGAGCSTESETSAAVSQPISGNSFSVSSPSGPGGVSLTVNGKFLSANKACGIIRMTLHPIPGPPPGVPGHIPSCGGTVETRWVAALGGVEQPPMDSDCISLPAQQAKPAQPEPRHGVVPKQAQAPPDGYFISNMVLGDPPGTVRLGQRLKGRFTLERGPQASSRGVAVELYWTSPSGMITNFGVIKTPSPGLESEASFEINVFSRQDLERQLDFNASFSRKPKVTLSDLEAVVRIVQMEPGSYDRKTVSNRVTAVLKIVE
jgi:hypothetical protein